MVRLNCDMGEGLHNIDPQLMPLIDMASIACGGHAGDDDSMLRTIELALEHNVTIGAHPSYPDKTHFGRRTLSIPLQQLRESLQQQIDSLSHCAALMGTTLTYIKAHGALYNDAMRSPEISKALAEVSQAYSLPLVVQAHPLSVAENSRILEAFADRSYRQDGSLQPRALKNAVHDSVAAAHKQASDIIINNGVFTVDNTWLTLSADTLCIHSDTPNAVKSARAIRQLLTKYYGHAS